MRGRVRGEHGGQDTWRGHVQVQYSTVQYSTVQYTWRGHVQAAPGPGHVWQRQSQQQQRVAVAVGRRLGAVCPLPLEVELDTNLRENYSFTITEAPNYAGIHPQYVDVKLR